MTRNDVIFEIQRRLMTIQAGNGYPFSLTSVQRNPEEAPSRDKMPLMNVFELPEVTANATSEQGTKAPVYVKKLTVIVEMWVATATEEEASQGINDMLRSARKALFTGGCTLGKMVSLMREVEVSRVFRPGIGGSTAGLGMVLELTYVEDFSKL